MRRRNHHLSNTLKKSVHQKLLNKEAKKEEDLSIDVNNFDVFLKYLNSQCRGSCKVHKKSDLIDVMEVDDKEIEAVLQVENNTNECVRQGCNKW